MADPDCTDAVWASFFGLIYRKFFWDFVGGTLRDPGGLQYVPVSVLHSSQIQECIRPSPNATLFITIIVKMPIIQIITMLIGFFMIALEFPLPQLKAFAIHRSIVLRIVVLMFQAFFGILFYQVRHVVFVESPLFICHVGYKCRDLVSDSRRMLHTGANAGRNNGGSEEEQRKRRPCVMATSDMKGGGDADTGQAQSRLPLP
jgi:hypothetical protein